MDELFKEQIEWKINRPLNDDEIARIEELLSGTKYYSVEEIFTNYEDLKASHRQNRNVVRIPPSHLGLRPRPYNW
jgi:hypothetical protein